jgi:hypothetical protein
LFIWKARIRKRVRAFPFLSTIMPSSPSSPTEICNMALGKIAAARINTLDSDGSTEAKACRLQYQHSINTLLERFQWSFATTRKDLSRLQDNPPTEWESAWQLPPDLVRLIRVTAREPQNPVRNFAIEGRKLLLNGADQVSIVYVTNSVPVPYWPSLFVDAAIFQLAANICADINKSEDLANSMLQKLNSLALPAAQTADAQQVLSGENFGPRQLASMSGLVAARYRADGRPPFIPTI